MSASAHFNIDCENQGKLETKEENACSASKLIREEMASVFKLIMDKIDSIETALDFFNVPKVFDNSAALTYPRNCLQTGSAMNTTPQLKNETTSTNFLSLSTENPSLLSKSNGFNQSTQLIEDTNNGPQTNDPNHFTTLPMPKYETKKLLDLMSSLFNIKNENECKSIPQSVPRPPMAQLSYNNYPINDGRPAYKVSTTTHCVNCNAGETTLWRRDDYGNRICNACGVYFRRYKKNRPVKFNIGVIKRRAFRGKNCSQVCIGLPPIATKIETKPSSPNEINES